MGQKSNVWWLSYVSSSEPGCSALLKFLKQEKRLKSTQLQPLKDGRYEVRFLGTLKHAEVTLRVLTRNAILAKELRKHWQESEQAFVARIIQFGIAFAGERFFSSSGIRFGPLPAEEREAALQLLRDDFKKARRRFGPLRAGAHLQAEQSHRIFDLTLDKNQELVKKPVQPWAGRSVAPRAAYKIDPH